MTEVLMLVIINAHIIDRLYYYMVEKIGKLEIQLQLL